jgi:hypothetical protein
MTHWRCQSSCRGSATASTSLLPTRRKDMDAGPSPGMTVGASTNQIIPSPGITPKNANGRGMNANLRPSAALCVFCVIASCLPFNQVKSWCVVPAAWPGAVGHWSRASSVPYVEKAEYEAWFRAEVQQGLREAADPRAEWVPQEQVEAEWQVRRAELLKRATAMRKRR